VTGPAEQPRPAVTRGAPATRRRSAMPPPQDGAPAAAPATPSRMTLANVVRAGGKEPPLRIMLVGTEGIGKSTFGASCPNPIVIPAERGLDWLQPPPATFPPPATWDDTIEAVRSLVTGEHAFETLVIDTVDFLEGLLYAKVKKDTGKDDMELEAYQRWLKIGIEYWRHLLRGLEVLQARKGMNVVLLVHASLGTKKNPGGADYQYYKPALQGDLAPNLLKSWCDAVLFVTYDLNYIDKAKDGVNQVRKAESTGQRTVYTTHTAAYEAKNRWRLPEMFELRDGCGWADLMYFKDLGLKGGAAPQEGSAQ